MKIMNPFTIAKDIKNIEKILKPALEKYIQGAGFAKSDEIDEILKKVEDLEKRIKNLEEKL
jgi:polyhydroxyalkanoate synthesis regulator phasin|tara:strand:- start:1363 stop:1545 length:183 start_codon:yes stop_codon:yes gene_type:complete